MDDLTLTCVHGFYSTKNTEQSRSIPASALVYIFFFMFLSWIQLLYFLHWASVTKRRTGWSPHFEEERGRAKGALGSGSYLDVKEWLLIPTDARH